MGTRNLTMVRKDGELKVAQYGQWDGYPSGQGLTVLNFCKDKDKLEKLKECMSKVQFITDEEAKVFNAKLKAHEEKADKYYIKYLHRDICADILQVIIDSNLDTIWLEDSGNFIDDGLFCEWAYCVNFDTNMLEVYECGNHKEAEYPLDNLPTKEEFLKLKRRVKNNETLRLGGFNRITGSI